MATNRPASSGDTDIVNRLMDKCVGEEAEGEMNTESGVEAYTLPHAKQIVSANLPCDSGNSNRGPVTTQRGGRGREVGGRFERAGRTCTCG